MSFLECYDTKMQHEVFCRCIATEMLDKALGAINFTNPNHWSLKKDDNRKRNKGAMKRTSRTWHFKKKMILEAEKMAALHPEEATQATTFVAMIFNIGRSQITDWKRSRTAIFKNAKGIKRNNTKAYKLRKGRFPACEAVVFEEFKDARDKGKQVGPKWLRQCMRREVAKQQPMGWRLFTSSSGWLWRFTKRMKIVIRRKTNTKREPIEKRVPKLKRWFATKRLFLLSKKGERGYCDKWSIYPRGNRWCLDQVPIGLFDPKTTYNQKGADHVHIASNGTADGHRIGTAQVLCRNAKKDPSLPRYGQPRMCLAARGCESRKKRWLNITRMWWCSSSPVPGTIRCCPTNGWWRWQKMISSRKMQNWGRGTCSIATICPRKSSRPTRSSPSRLAIYATATSSMVALATPTRSKWWMPGWVPC